MNAEAFIPLAEAKRQQARVSARSLPIFTARELGNMEFQPIKFVVPGYLPEGATILAGRPKLGKSWLCLEIAVAVATGGECLGGVQCPQGDVLYLALEDNPRRLQERIAKIRPARAMDPWPKRLSFATDWRRAASGGVDDIRTWAKTCDEPRLVVVDVFAQFREARGNQETQYESDYAAVKGLQELAAELNIGIVIVHHTRKGVSETDRFEAVSGTLGLQGGVDSVIMLDRDSNGFVIHCKGRDVPEYEKAIAFDKIDCRWTIQGDASVVHRSEERSTILDALLDADDLLSVKDIQSATGMNRNALDQLLYKMAKDGQVVKVRRGQYAHPDRAHLYPHKKDKEVRNQEGDLDA